MKDRLKKIWEFLKKPPTYFRIITYVVAIISIIASLLFLLVDYEGSALEILAYALFGLAGTSLGYGVYLFIPTVPKIKSKIIAAMQKREFTRRLLSNYGYRTVVFTALSFAITLVFSAFNAYMGIVNRSIWYGALAAYYIALAFLRGGILSGRKTGKNEGTISEEYSKIKTYRNSGIVMLVLNVALSSAIAQMIFSDAHFTYVGLTIFAFAAYAFFKITMAIINIVRASKYPDITIKAIRNVNLADATVSILALQTALLTMFDEGGINISLMNTLTGCAVSFISIGIGVYMIVKATKLLKNLKKETPNDERESV